MILTLLLTPVILVGQWLIGLMPDAPALPQGWIDATTSVIGWMKALNTFFPLDTAWTIAQLSLPIIIGLVLYRVALFVMEIIALIRKTFFI